MSKDDKITCPCCFQVVDFLEYLGTSRKYGKLVNHYACKTCVKALESENLDFKDHVGNYDGES